MGEPEQGPGNLQTGHDFSLQRVKVYSLNESGNWDDKGTGHVSVEYLERSEAAGLVVIGEQERETLLLHKISSEDIYQQQGEETIITWSDEGVGADIALSFQEAAGCNHVWDQIGQVQRSHGKIQSSSPGIAGEEHEHLLGPGGSSVDSTGRRFAVDEFESAAVSPSGALSSSMAQNPVDLPSPELRNLQEMAKLMEGLSPFQRERVAAQMCRPKFVRQLLDQFRACEDLEDEESLKYLYVIMKHAIMLNHIQLLEILFNEENVMDAVGALEYDPDALAHSRHREWLSEKVIFREVVRIADVRLRAKIHQTYRMGYVKDAILPRALDDATFATLSSLMLFNNVEVVMALHSDARFLPDLLQRLWDGPKEAAWAELVALLQELTGLARHLQPGNRTSLFTRLGQLGLFQVLTIVLEKGSEAMQLKAIDVILSSVHHDPRPLRDFLIAQHPSTLFSLLVRPLKEGGAGGLQEGALEVLRALLDPENMTVNAEKSVFLDTFYEQHVSALVKGLTDTTDKSGCHGQLPASVQGLILELLCYCVVNHSYRMKYFVLKNNLVGKVLKLLRRKERWLAVAAIRFLRTCLNLKDEFYNRYLVRENLMEPVVEAFLANGPRYNLLNSAVLELFDFIRRENIRALIEHFVERFWERLQHIDYVDTFQALKLKHEQASERHPGGNGHAHEDPADSSSVPITHRTHVLGPHSRTFRDPRAPDKDEEDYFREEEDEDPEPSVRGLEEPDSPRPPLPNGTALSHDTFKPLSALADYGNDDDDDNGDASSFLSHKRRSPSPSTMGKRSRIEGEHMLSRGLHIVSPAGHIKTSGNQQGTWHGR